MALVSSGTAAWAPLTPWTRTLPTGTFRKSRRSVSHRASRGRSLTKGRSSVSCPICSRGSSIHCRTWGASASTFCGRSCTIPRCGSSSVRPGLSWRVECTTSIPTPTRLSAELAASRATSEHDATGTMPRARCRALVSDRAGGVMRSGGARGRGAAGSHKRGMRGNERPLSMRSMLFTLEATGAEGEPGAGASAGSQPQVHVLFAPSGKRCSMRGRQCSGWRGLSFPCRSRRSGGRGGCLRSQSCCFAREDSRCPHVVMIRCPRPPSGWKSDLLSVRMEPVAGAIVVPEARCGMFGGGESILQLLRDFHGEVQLVRLCGRLLGSLSLSRIC
mmetsp:Transcript_6703/g.15033  ORF Transcript_6703/g.15033 Transcript_6703/m.15033 type:complete len:331 (-) Transcript_6703:191-1183(-)